MLEQAGVVAVRKCTGRVPVVGVPASGEIGARVRVGVRVRVGLGLGLGLWSGVAVGIEVWLGG